LKQLIALSAEENKINKGEPYIIHYSLLASISSTTNDSSNNYYNATAESLECRLYKLILKLQPKPIHTSNRRKACNQM